MINDVLLDMDGVLVDWVSGALAVHGIERSIEDLYANDHGQWDLRKLIDVADMWGPLEEDFWANLPWMHDGREILSLVEQQFGRRRITICTSPTFNYGCWSGKRKWIERHLPSHYHDVKNQMFASQKHLAARPGTLLVDDSDANVDRFEAKGGHVLHVPRIWNRLHAFRGQTLSVLQNQIKEKFC